MLRWWAPNLGPEASDELRRAAAHGLGAAAEVVFEAGLLSREGRHLIGFERAVHRFLSSHIRADATPERVSVCEACQLVFGHRRRATRPFCDACHATPRRHRSIVDIDCHGVAIVDPARGNILARLSVCEHCGDRFESSRARRFCKPNCQRRHARATPPPAGSIAAALAAAEDQQRQWLAEHPWDALSDDEQHGWQAHADTIKAVAAERAAAARGQIPQFTRKLALAAEPLSEQLAATGSLIDPPEYVAPAATPSPGRAEAATLGIRSSTK